MDNQTQNHRSGGFSSDGRWLPHGDPNSLASRLVTTMSRRRRTTRESPSDFVMSLSRWRWSTEATKLIGSWTIGHMAGMVEKDDWSAVHPETAAAEYIKRCGRPSNDTCTWGEDGIWLEKPWARSS